MAKFSASMMLGQKTPKKRPGTGTQKRLTQGDTVEMDMTARQLLGRSMPVQCMSAG